MYFIIRALGFVAFWYLFIRYVPGAIPIIIILVLFNGLLSGAEYPQDYYHKAKRRVPQWKKLMPWWWFGNDDDPVYPVNPDAPGTVKNDWYLFDQPQLLREIRWGIRNFMCNFRRYVTGFYDKHHAFSNTEQYAGRSWLRISPPWAAFRIKIPLISFEVEGGAGWKKSGFGPTIYFRKQQ